MKNRRTTINRLDFVAVLVILVGCATAKEPGDPTAVYPTVTRVVVQNPAKPQIQIENPREFVGELARLGASVRLVDRDFIKNLFEWVPNFTPDRDRLHAALPQQGEFESGIKQIIFSYTPGNIDNEKGVFHLFLHPKMYCIRVEDMKAILGDHFQVQKPSPNLWGRFPRIQPLFGATYRTSPTSLINFIFEYQECVQRVLVLKNVQ
jgi:hypothetical protein